MTGNIVWIASYPKSGNTWFRAFIANLLSGANEPVHINTLAVNGNTRHLFDAMSGIDSACLFPEEVDRLRPDFYKKISMSSGPDCCFYKIHDAYRRLPDGRAIFPSELTRCTIYIVRNPLDVALSFAHFLRRDFDQIIAEMNEDGYTFNLERRSITRMLLQEYSSWSSNVLTWLNAPSGMKVHLMRYEDMLRNPEETFGQAVHAIGLDHSEEQIRRAITFSSFETLREMERKEGFREKPPQAGAFFREGKAGSWREILSRKQTSALIEKNRTAMQRLGYLDADGSILDL